MVGWCSGLVGAVFPDRMRETSASISWFSGNLRHLVFGVVFFLHLLGFQVLLMLLLLLLLLLIVGCWLLVVGC